MGLARAGRVTEWRIDATNPAEVLACAGLAHLAWRTDRAARTGFVFAAAGEVRFAAPELPGRLELEELEPDGVWLWGAELDWWRPWGLNSSLKSWSGQQTAWTVHRSLRDAVGHSTIGEWLTYTASGRGRLYVDPCGTWDTLGLGWSVNEHSRVRMCCRPWVELLASLGLQAFPVPGTRAGGYRYHLWRPAALPVAVAAFGGRVSCVHSLGGYHATTAKTGPNTMLRRATPLVAGASAVGFQPKERGHAPIY